MTDPKHDTALIHGGRRKDWTLGIVNPPVFHASTCVFETLDQFDAACANPDAGLYYARRGTPTVWALESALHDIEPGSAGVKVCSSGVAAITVAMLSALSAGDHLLLPDSAYEPSRILSRGLLMRLGIETSVYDPLIGGGIAELFKPNTRAVWVESPGSLSFEVQDVPGIARVAHERGAAVIMDNTWATPLLFPAHERGVDISVQSLSKYVCGHSDLLMGSVSANAQWWPKVKSTTLQMGQCAGPDDVFLALRGLRTLGVRLRHHEAAALTIARWLSSHPMITRLLHPAFESCDGHATWQRDFHGSSGLFSVQLAPRPRASLAAMVDGMRHFSMGFSWGGYESLVLPCNISPINRSLNMWRDGGPLLRLNIGLEHVDDLIADLDSGLARYSA
jgi:cysteine-S-conjugate beta-lyase